MRRLLLFAWWIIIHSYAALAGERPPSTGHENRAGVVFSPDGNTAYWVAWNGRWGAEATSPRTIFIANRTDGGWSVAEPLPISGTFNDDDPFVSPDGAWLYFVSDRPATDGGPRSEGDLWRFELQSPHRLERLDVSASEADYSPVVTASGALYFASARPGGLGQGDLWRAEARGETFAAPDSLGPAVNSPTGEWNLWVSPDEQQLLFEASSRPSNVSVPGDLYYSRRTATGWTAAIPVTPLNSGDSDLLPRPGPSGEALWYTTAPIGGHARVVSTDWNALQGWLQLQFEAELLVANRSSHELTVVDVGEGRVAARVTTGEGPHLLSNVVNGRVVVTGFGEFPEPHAEPVTSRPPFVEQLNSRLQWIDIAERRMVLDTMLENCLRPHASWIVDGYAYVTCQDERQLLEIELASGAERRRFDTGQAGSHVLAFEPRSRTMSVSNTDDGSVSLVNLDRGEVRIVKLGGGSEGAIAFDGQIWVGNAWQGTVSVVDPVAGAEIHRTGKLCSFPISLAAGARGRIWLACFGSGELVALDRGTYEVTARIALDAQPLHLLLHPAADIAWVSLPRENAVAEISLHAGVIVRKIRVGIEPDGLRWSP
ncbi:MAG: hypothetical protein R3348_03150 [Xanthomonadales bacterium]|nr:hypothetical protein [Xanthomonadales bacterium]